MSAGNRAAAQGKLALGDDFVDQFDPRAAARRASFRRWLGDIIDYRLGAWVPGEEPEETEDVR